MRLSPHEQERLMVRAAADVARARRARGSGSTIPRRSPSSPTGC